MLFTETSVYSRGFKGLPDGWKTMLPVTFVVGENSSGKTSLFDLISILDSGGFNFMNQILQVTDGIDRASDAISKFRNQDDVTIGYLCKDDSEEKDDRNPKFVGKLVTFLRSGETLVIKAITLFHGQKAIRIKMRGQCFMQKVFQTERKRDTLKSACRLASEAHFYDGAGFKTLFDVGEKTARETEWFQASAIGASIVSGADLNKGRLRAPMFAKRPPFNAFRYGPIRSESSRLHYGVRQSNFETSGEHYPFRIKKLADVKSNAFHAIKDFGRSSGLFDDLRVVKLKGENKTEAFSIIYSKFGKDFFADELGYGLGQIIPIVTDLLDGKPKETYLIQQPEVHLHPKAQAAFGSLLFEISESGFSIIVETHSDFLIDRFRLKQAQAEKQIKSQILFFERSQSNNRPSFSAIEISSNGQLLNVPESYRDFFVNESIEIFEKL